MILNATTATRKPAAGPRRIAKYHVPVEWVRGVDLCARSAEIEWYPDDMEA